jgi:hypothetical protein
MTKQILSAGLPNGRFLSNLSLGNVIFYGWPHLAIYTISFIFHFAIQRDSNSYHLDPSSSIPRFFDLLIETLGHDYSPSLG